MEEMVVVEAKEVVELFERVVIVLPLLVGLEEVFEGNIIWAIEEVSFGRISFCGVPSILERFIGKASFLFHRISCV